MVAVPPLPVNTDYFTFFGIEERLDLHSQDLEKRFYQLSRKWHPDLFARRSAAEQQEALENTALLNDAYRTLREPISRAEYVLSRHGLEVSEQKSGSVPPELLEEVFELNMALEELRSGDADAKPQLESAQTKFLGMRDEIDQDLQAEFTKYDPASPEKTLGEIRALLNRRNYIRNLITEVEKTLATHG